MKKNLKYYLLTVLTAFLVSTTAAQQDPLYSQYMFNQLAINPAYTGIHNVLNISANSRYQWSGLEGSPKTNTLTANSSFFGNKVGGGIIIVHDRLGVNTNTEIDLSYSYKIQWSQNILSFGLQAGFVNSKFDYTKLNQRSTVNDPSFQPVSEGASKPNFGTGLAFKNEKLFLGISVPRLLNAEIDDGVVTSTRNERHYYVTAGYILDIGTNLKLKPMVLLKAVDNAPASFDVSASVFMIERLWAGVFTRNLNTYGIMAQFEMTDALRLGYSFETPDGSFIESNLYSHEVMVSLDLALFGSQIVNQRYF